MYPRGRKWWYKARVAGKLVQRSTDCTEKADAVAYVLERVAPLLAAQDLQEVAGRVQTVMAGVAPVRLAQVWELWAELPRSVAMRQRVRSGYRTGWLAWVRWLAANEPATVHLHATTTKQAMAFVKSLEGLSGRTRFEYRRSCRRVTQDLLRRAGMTANPWDEVPVPQQDVDGYDAFTPEQLQTIGKKATGWVRDVFVTGAYTGLRLSDLARLVWAPAGPEDMALDWEAQYIFGRMSKTRSRNRRLGYVELPVLPPLRKHLEGRARPAGEPVFPELAERYGRDPYALSAELQTFLRDLGFTTRRAVEGRDRAALKLGVHSLRHTFVYEAGRAGVPLAVVQQVVGHMSERMTMLYNRHAQRDTVRAQLTRLPDFLGLLEPEPTPAAEAAGDPPEDVEALLDQLEGPDHVKQQLRKLLEGTDD